MHSLEIKFASDKKPHFIIYTNNSSEEKEYSSQFLQKPTDGN